MIWARLAILIVFGVGVAISSTTLAQPNPAAGYAIALPPPLSASAGTYVGPSAAVIKDLRTGGVSRVTLERSDEIYSAPQPDDPINNVPGFAIPIQPPDSRITLVLFTVDGQNKRCVGAAIGRRLILTAGHCVSSDTTGQFASSASVIPGYDADNGSNTPINAVRLIAFSGWIDARDNAHDIGIIELGADLPATIVPFRFEAFGPACPASPILAYYKRYYSPDLSNGGKQYAWDGQYGGCHLGTLYHRLPTARGSSGSPSTSPNDRDSITTVVSAISLTKPYGYDARLTSGKMCFIITRLMGGICQ